MLQDHSYCISLEGMQLAEEHALPFHSFGLDANDPMVCPGSAACSDHRQADTHSVLAASIWTWMCSV